MYSYEKRLRAVKLYIKYDHSLSAAIRELGYPSHQAMLQWYRKYITQGDLHAKCVRHRRRCKFTMEQRKAAVAYTPVLPPDKRCGGYRGRCSNSRLFNSSSFSAIASLTSCKEKNLRSRSAAIIQVSAKRTEASAELLSFGRRTRARTIAVL